jgi:hypothetical protein
MAGQSSPFSFYAGHRFHNCPTFVAVATIQLKLFFMQLLRTILIIIIAYYLFRLISIYVMPWIARYFIRRSMKGFGEQQKKKAGDVHINHAPDKKGALDNIGEYVDYEEVEEEKTK